MSEIVRYDLLSRAYGYSVQIQPQGAYVLYSDHAAEVQRLREEVGLMRRALMAIQERSNMAKTFVFLHTCGFSLADLEEIYQGCLLAVSDDGSVLDAQWEAAKQRIAATKAEEKKQ